MKATIVTMYIGRFPKVNATSENPTATVAQAAAWERCSCGISRVPKLIKNSETEPIIAAA